jgi:CRISPR system Cascade subunit CasD
MITVVRLSAPILAWPSPSKYTHRFTEPMPTLSALQGILAAAAGVRRGQQIPEWISEATMAARADLPGSVLRDFHTINPPDRTRYHRLSAKDRLKVRTVVKADGAERVDPVITERYYRSDQTIVWFIDDPEEMAYAALSSPFFTIYAGRKACPLSFPLNLGRVPGSIEDALVAVPTTAPAGAPVEAVLFTPTTLPHYRPVALRPEHPAGRVGESYAMQQRFSVLVDPPRVASWFDVISLLERGTANVAH